jgi:hypothetical protein
MAKRSKPARDPAATFPGNVARSARDTLRSYTVGALPILDQFLRRMRLEDFLRGALPPEDRRTKLSPAKALLVLLRNLVLSREPIYENRVRLKICTLLSGNGSERFRERFRGHHT